MKKIVFKSGKELEIDGITQSGKSLQISIKSSDVKSIIDTFSDAANTTLPCMGVFKSVFFGTSKQI